MSAVEAEPGREEEEEGASPLTAPGDPPPVVPDEGEEARASPAGSRRSDGDGRESEGREAEGRESEGSRAEGESPASPSPGGPSRPETARSDPADTFHLVKWIVWKGEQTPLITQSENGPCPLIALINILLLRWKVKLPPKTEVISVEQLMTLLGDCILSAKPREDKQVLQLNFEQNMSDAMSVLPKLSTGLDVNVRFTGVGDFEYTPECIIFDMLDVPLYHGWLIDPQSRETVHAVGRCSYNQLVEKIISSKHSLDSALVSEGLVAEQFLDATATQLTYHGLCELTSAAREGELCVFFRNNHFSTLVKHKGHLYLLVTDQGFLSEQKVVWESLHNVEGDGNFCDSEFCLSHPSGRQVPFNIAQAPQEQINQDYMVALSLQQQQEGAEGMSDVELAMRLQEEENQRTAQLLQEQEAQRQAPPARQAASSHRPTERRSHRQEKTGKDCAIL